ncbi:MAG: hypothetical protein ABII00_18610 [Elusimicrobiota bacterium]
MRTARRLRGKRGQIAVAALFVFPILFLFVFLIFETARLSRDKIRQQFALDAGASLESGLYSGYLNRIAYINGPFPDRLFSSPDLSNSAVRYAQDYASGFFPRSVGPHTEYEKRWRFLWSPATRGGMNTQFPPQYTPVLFINQEAASTRMAVFMTVWHKLGYILDAHMDIFNAHNEKHSLMRQTMYHNLHSVAYKGSPLPRRDYSNCTDPETCGDQAVSGFMPLPVTKHVAIGFEDNDDDEIVYFSPPLFQVATVRQEVLDRLEDGHVVIQGWDPGRNYFKVNFGIQHVRNRVSVHGGRVWTDATPRFRSYLKP